MRQLMFEPKMMRAIPPGRCWHARLILRLAVILLPAALSGCASLTNPVKDGIPASQVPEELLARPRESTVPLRLSLLGQQTTTVYRLAPGDTLGVWIDGVLSSPAQGPPVHQPPGRSKTGPTLGYPIPVRENGTVALPLVRPVDVAGMTVEQAETAIREAYVAAKVLQAGRDRILVTLLRRREYHILVMRDDAQNFNTPGGENPSLVLAATNKRGNGHALDLAAGENDVLHALARTGGLPGLDAYNAVIVEHKSPRPTGSGRGSRPGTNNCAAPSVIRIPLSVAPGEQLPFASEDVVLDDGDVVYLEQRDVERFYTGGLLPAGEYLLPRNYDLDVLEAIAYVKGPLVNGAYGVFGGAGAGGAGATGAGFNGATFGGPVLAGSLIDPGVGGPSPSLLTVLRRTPGGGQVCIHVDLNRAFCDPKERILVKAGDVLILQQTPEQAVARYFAGLLDRITFDFSFQKVSNSAVSTGTTVVRPPGP
jgi:Polysaccharide biosynthesis/export protein